MALRPPLGTGRYFTVTVIEPDVTIDKSVDDPTPGPTDRFTYWPARIAPADRACALIANRLIRLDKQITEKEKTNCVQNGLRGTPQ